MSSSYKIKTDRVEDLPDRFLHCRVFGHQWDEIPSTLADPVYQMLFDYYITTRCISCGTERFDGINKMGQVGQRSYKYPSYYSLSVKIDRKQARLEYLTRKAAQAAMEKLAERR